MDVDLSTDLRALLPLVAPLISGHSDLAIGTRLSRSSRVVRGPKREIISRSYNLMLRGALSASFSDAQCGFKAIRADVARDLLPLVEDESWFFDTELLVLAQRAGLRIHEVPVDWVDDPDSRVDIVATAQGGPARRRPAAARLRRRSDPGGAGCAPSWAVTPRFRRPCPGVPRGLLGQLLRFGGVGRAEHARVLRPLPRAARPHRPQTANLVALLVTAVGQHRREPARDLRRPRGGRRAAPPRRRADRLRSSGWG